MPLIDSAKKEINFKIVYYGPGRSGKTTSLTHLQKLISAKRKTPIKKTSPTEQTLFFDFLALSSETIGGYKTRFQVYTVPGQILYDESRRLLLKGVDGVIFVADSQLEKIQDNLVMLDELKNYLREMGESPGDIPMVIQYNKRDLPQAPAIEELRQTLNPNHVPDFESVATTGEGVLDAFQECIGLVLISLKESFSHAS